MCKLVTGFRTNKVSTFFRTSQTRPHAIFSTFARHTKPTHKSQPCKRAKNATALPTHPSGRNFYELHLKHQQHNYYQQPTIFYNTLPLRLTTVFNIKCITTCFKFKFRLLFCTAFWLTIRHRRISLKGNQV
jgi:hypothetical protein